MIKNDSFWAIFAPKAAWPDFFGLGLLAWPTQLDRASAALAADRLLRTLAAEAKRWASDRAVAVRR